MHQTQAYPSTGNCLHCGASNYGQSSGETCPACLMKLGLNAANGGSGPRTGGEQTVAYSAADLPMEDLAEKFPQLEILRLIGRGGMGTVYCARQKSLERLVALKIIRPPANDRQLFADRFAREARALAQLSHPNIVTVHDFGQIGDIYYFVMEFIDGVNLRQMLQEERLPPETALQIVPAICDALQFAHDHGIVHRDIKPENILIDTNGLVKIADFGLAKIINNNSAGPSLTRTNHVMGTMHYMAPEQYERPLDVDHRADIYSLGVVLYELLTGELPIGRFAPPSRKVVVDVRLDEIVLHTLEKEPELRYQKISEVKTDMQGVQPGSAEFANAAQGMPVRNEYDSRDWPGTAHPPAPATKQLDKTARPNQTVWIDPNKTGPIPPGGFYKAVQHRQTYKNLLYLFGSFPLALLYFVVTVVGLSVGSLSLILWIGIPILLGALVLIHGFAALEVKLASRVLNLPIVARRPVEPVSGGWLHRIKAFLFRGQTWLNVAYFLVKYPLSVVSFVVAILCSIFPVAFMLAPISVLIPGNEMRDWNFGLGPYGNASLLSLVGFGLVFVAAHLVNGMAWLNGRWAMICLGTRGSNVKSH